MPLTTQFLVHSLSLLGIGLIGPISLIYESYRVGEAFEAPPLEELLLPMVSAFAISILIFLVFIRRITFSLTKRIRAQSFELGFVEDPQGFLFSNFGSNLFFGMTTGFLAIEFFVCPGFLMNLGTQDFSQATKIYFRCRTFDFSIIAFVTAAGMVYFLWMFFQVRLLEKEVNHPILVHYYKARDSSLFGLIILGVGVAYIITQAFFQLVTLGAPWKIWFPSNRCRQNSAEYKILLHGTCHLARRAFKILTLWL